MQEIQAPKGTKDVIPSESHKWHYIEREMRELCALYGASELRTPIIEHTELFARGVGDTTDIVQKEMYTFEDKGGRSITLKPEGTAGMVRAFLENRLFNEPMPQKLYYLNSPTFRYEKPQAGRLREHHQFGIECFGAASYEADAEVISLAASFIKRLGIKTKLKINSIGCPSCRPAYHKALRDYFEGRREELCETCRGRLSKNPMRILDCKSPECQKIAAGAPKVTDHLCDECRAHLSELTSLLDGMGIAYELDPGIVRGLDYYTKTVFEFIAPVDVDKKTGEKKELAICAGGRYDGLVEEIGGPSLPGIGFAAGMDRLVAAIRLSEQELPAKAKPAVYFAALGARAAAESNKLAYRLRQEGIYAECDIVGRSLKAQMKYADKIGAKYTVIIGDNELDRQSAVLKNMEDGAQLEVSFEELYKILSERG
jgi:histidyl-tRNA synthetase